MQQPTAQDALPKHHTEYSKGDPQMIPNFVSTLVLLDGEST
jgi:hypothetical protein